MVYRNASDKDIESIFALVCELESTTLDLEDFSSVYLDNLEDKNIHYIVAENRNKEIVGFISLHIQKLLHHVGKIGKIQELIISAKERGRGVGKELLKQAKGIALDSGCIQLEVCCNRKRKESHEFYMSQEFKKTHYKFTDKISY